MYKNKRGAALLQVLMLSALLAGLSVMVLRATLSRQVTARKTRHDVGVHAAIEACAAEIYNMWAVMTPEQYKTRLSSCSLPPMPAGTQSCAGGAAASNEWYCRVNPYGTKTYCITAKMGPKEGGETESPCQISFKVHDGVKL